MLTNIPLAYRQDVHRLHVIDFHLRYLQIDPIAQKVVVVTIIELNAY